MTEKPYRNRSPVCVGLFEDNENRGWISPKSRHWEVKSTYFPSPEHINLPCIVSLEGRNYGINKNHDIKIYPLQMPPLSEALEIQKQV